MDPIRKKRLSRRLRHKRIRKRVQGTNDQPRLSIYRSLKSISAQIIDDSKGITILSLSSLSKEVGKESPDGGNPPAKGKKIKEAQESAHKGKIEISRIVGNLLAKKALEKGIKKVVFDRGGFLYDGRVKSLAEGARKGGLEF